MSAEGESRKPVTRSPLDQPPSAGPGMVAMVALNDAGPVIKIGLESCARWVRAGVILLALATIGIFLNAWIFFGLRHSAAQAAHNISHLGAIINARHHEAERIRDGDDPQRERGSGPPERDGVVPAAPSGR